MDVSGTVSRWYHKPFVTLTVGVLVGLALGAAIVGISMRQLYMSAKGRLSSTAA